MKPSPAMRAALEKLLQGFALAQSWGGKVSGEPLAWFPDFYDGSKRYGGRYVSMATFKALRNRKWIVQTECESSISTWAITEAGREVMKP
jgi:hypothetical protein